MTLLGLSASRPLGHLFLWLLMPFVSTAQLIQVQSPTQLSFTASEQQFIQKMNLAAETQSIQYVSIGDIAQFETNGVVNLTLPGIAGSFPTEAVHVEYVSPTDYIWSGNFTSVPGYFSIIRKPEGAGGFYLLPGKFFSIVPLNGTVSLLRELNLADVPKEDCGNKLLPPIAENEIDWCVPEPTDCFAEIDVLILLSSPDVYNWFNAGLDQLQAIITTLTGIESVNLAFANSGIPNKRLRWRVEPFSFEYSDPLDIGLDVESLRMSAAALRVQMQADAVIMLTAKDYPDYSGATSTTCGLHPESDCAYSIVEIKSIADPRWTFAHEFAHILGANHNREGNCSVAGFCGDQSNFNTYCARGLVFTDASGNEQRTLMALLDKSEVASGSGRLLNFSNPLIDFNGVPTGTIINDNARVIRNTACFVAQYNRAEWVVGIEGPDIWCTTTEPQVIYEATVQTANIGWGYPGLPPYQYEWRWNSSPIPPIIPPGNPNYHLISTQSSITLTSPPATPNFWLFLKVTSADGLIKTGVVRVRVSCNLIFGGNGNRTAKNVTLTDERISIRPNPAGDLITVRAEGFNGQPLTSLRVFDVFGKLVDAFRHELDVDFELDTRDYPNGIYYMLLSNDHKTETRSFIIHKP